MKRNGSIFWLIFVILITSCSLFDDSIKRKDIPLELVYEDEFQYSASSPGFIATRSSQLMFLVDYWNEGEIVRLNTDFTVDKVFKTESGLSGLMQSANDKIVATFTRGDYDLLELGNDFSSGIKIELEIPQWNNPTIIKTADGYVAMYGYGSAGFEKGVVHVQKYDFKFNKQWETELETGNGDVGYYDDQNDELLFLTYTHMLIKIDNKNAELKEKIKLNLSLADVVQKIVRNDDNLYFLSSSNQTIDTIPDNRTDIDGCCCNDDIVVYKTDMDGAILWQQSLGAGNANDLATDLIVNSEDEIFVSGKWGEDNCINRQGFDGNYSDIYLIKLSGSGQVLGEKIMGAGNEFDAALGLVKLNNKIYVMCQATENVNDDLKNWLRIYKVE